MRRGILAAAFAASAVAVLVFAGILLKGPGAASDEPLLVYCGAGLRVPVEAAARAFEKATGRRVELQYGGSQTLLANAQASGRGDLYVPADDLFISRAREKKLLAEVFALARMAPVLAVRKTNPKGIRSVDDLLRADVKLSVPNPDAAAAGTLFREALRKAGRWEAVEKATAVFKPTVNDVGNDLRLGAVDAGILWDALLAQVPEAEVVPLPELSGVEATVSAGVLRTSADPTGALRLARWLAAADRGGRDFAAAGFRPSGGDAWEDRPRLVVHAGSMLRPGLERTIDEFKAREGADVVTTYNGCGILVAQMKAGERPDLYFACDTEFMKMVKEHFEAPVDVTLNQLVILVKKGNPHGIKRLRDLAKPGLRVGVGNEKQCALGELTQTALREEGARADVERNIVMRTPSGDMLVNHMRVGAMDAAVTYLSNAAGAGDTLEAVAVDLPCAIATQPVAVGKGSARKALAARLLEALVSPVSRERFEAWGFRWKAAR